MSWFGKKRSLCSCQTHERLQNMTCNRIRLYISSNIYNQSGGTFSQRLSQHQANKLKKRDDNFDTVSWNRQELAADPYQVFGDTALFARGPSVESWPWWTDPAAPAELTEGKPGEEVKGGKCEWRESKCEISLSDGKQQMSSALVCTRYIIPLSTETGQHTCSVNWWTRTAGLNWHKKKRHTWAAWHHKHIFSRQIKTSRAHSENSPKSAAVPPETKWH